MSATRHWIILIGAFVLIVLAYQFVWPAMVSRTGLPGPSVVQAAHPSPAAVMLGIGTLFAAIVAMTTGRLVSGLSGLVILGAALGWAGLALAPMRDVLFHGSAPMLAIDLLAWAIVVLAISWAVLTLGASVADVHPEVAGREPDPLASPEAMRMLIAGLAALPLVWLFAQSDMRGQTFAATSVGGIAAGVVGRMWSPHVQPVLLPLGVVLAGTLATLVCGFMLPDIVDRAYTTGEVPTLLLTTPVDLAGL